jgi:hypothetical protein
MTKRSPLWAFLTVVLLITAVLFAPVGCDKEEPVAEGECCGTPGAEGCCTDAEGDHDHEHPSHEHPSGD